MSTRVLASLALRFTLGALLFSGCTWEPVARPAQPKLLFAGPAHVDRLLGDGRYALVRTGPEEMHRVRLVRTDNFEWCELPEGSEPFQNPLTPPNVKAKGTPLLQLPVLRPKSDGQEGRELYFADEKCALTGPFGPSAGGLERLQLKGDGRQVALLLERDRKLRLVDPWRSEMRMIAEGVRFYTSVDQDPNASAAQALWLFENDRLTQRALDGTLLLQVGTKVSGFAQTLLRDGLRVAFSDGPDLYEAASPYFTPVLVAEDACSPSYSNTLLDFHVPCADDQLVRLDLVTGQVRRFSSGVFNVFPLGEFEAEQVHGADGDEVWLSLGPTTRVKLEPPPQAHYTPLDRTTLAALTGDEQFGVWSLRSGFTSLVQGVKDLQVYRAPRTNQYLWLMLHEVEGDFGKLSIFDQSDVERVLAGLGTLAPRTLATQVPVGGNGYRIGGLPSQREPVVVTIEQAFQQPGDQAFAGTLHVSLLSGVLASLIDEGVSSFQLVVAPLPGVLYGVTEGANNGLWFAAL
jgi:hypothetical protein